MNYSIYLISIAMVITSACSDHSSSQSEQKTASQIAAEIRDTKVDSIYISLTKKHAARYDWESYKYKHLFQLQDYLEQEPRMFAVKYFSQYEIYRVDSIYKCDYRITQFWNDIYLDLKINGNQLKDLTNIDEEHFYNYNIAIIQIDSIKPIDFSFYSQMDDYHSIVVTDRYISLRGKGELIDLVVFKEEREPTTEQ